MTRDDSESPFIMFLGGLVFGVVILGIHWLVAKPLLHGQLDWLVWMPLALGAGMSALAMLPDRWGGGLLILCALPVALVGAPVGAKVEQLKAEERFADSVEQLLYAEASRVATRDEVIEAGWEICAGLDEVNNAPDGTFPASDPARTVARFVISGTAQAVQDEEPMVRVVHAADRYLC